MPQQRLSLHLAAFAAVAGLGCCFGVSPVRSQTPAATAGPRVVVVIGEDSYRTAETLPAFVRRELEPLGMRTTIVTADPKDPNHFPGIEAVRDADLIVLSVRRRTPPDAELALIRGNRHSSLRDANLAKDCAIGFEVDRY